MKIRCLLFLLIATFTGGASAHVRWFVDTAAVPEVSFVFNTNMMITFIMAVVFLAVTAAITSYFNKQGNSFSKIMSTNWEPPAFADWYLLFVLLIAMLVINLLVGDYLAPNLIATGWVAIIGIVIQVVVVALLMVTPSIVGLAMIIVAFLNLFLFGFTLGMDYFFELAFVGLAFVFIGPNVSKLDRFLFRSFMPEENRWKDLAVLALRIGLGLQLIELAINNKFINTGYSLLFMEQNSFYNFMALIGLDFSLTDFVYFVGIFEFLTGLMLVLGLATRLVVITLTVAFAFTAVLTGITELVGHLPIIGAAVVLLLRSQTTYKQANTLSPQIA